MSNDCCMAGWLAGLPHWGGWLADLLALLKVMRSNG